MTTDDEATSGRAGGGAGPAEPVIAEDLLAILACPACRGDISLDGTWLVCAGCGRRYPIEDGIPIMLVERAELPA
jgi:uncharacterized protein YbaR (Trm112 family)